VQRVAGRHALPARIFDAHNRFCTGARSRDFRFGSLAVAPASFADVCFTPDSGHGCAGSARPLWATSRLIRCNISSYRKTASRRSLRSSIGCIDKVCCECSALLRPAISKEAETDQTDQHHSRCGGQVWCSGHDTRSLAHYLGHRNTRSRRDSPRWRRIGSRGSGEISPALDRAEFVAAPVA
jgi:hypothetical protein